ncbi:universal stress protein [Bacillus tianshenii]|uniref:universal stress protein n=1 Tax=Sutcliffiella tianshenii TaxID=1463404 RepID=UPI001CD409AB|nr:universal stress protein [Bacillus tianshenii]MCA1321236.1 universal stress protein [Bacillus tianshenii]
MHAFNNILIAYDGSEGSVKAVKLGIDMMRRLDSNITVLHVLEEKMTGAPVASRQPEALPIGGFGLQDMNMYANNVKEPAPSNRPSEDVHYDPTEESAREIRELLAQERVEAPVEVMVGDPSKTICKFAETQNHDLIIIGSRGLGGLKKLILGSVSDKVTNSATCPVLVAK